MNNNWTHILMNCGIDAECLVNRHGPCPICGGKDRFRYDNKKGNGNYYCSGCGAGDGFGLLKKFHNITFEDALIMAREAGLPITRSTTNHVALNQSHDDRSKSHMDIVIAQCQLAAGTPVETYLNNRGLAIPDPISDDVQCFYAESVEHFDPETGAKSWHPCMVWVVRTNIGSKYKAMHGISSLTNIMIHKTYITADGNKAPVAQAKKYSPRWLPEHVTENLGSCYVPVCKARGESDYVLISEGIENTIAAHSLLADLNVDCMALAMTNANNLKKFGESSMSDQHDDNYLGKHYLPKYLREKKFLVFADNDSSFVGQVAANTAAFNVMRSGSTCCTVYTPHETGQDWADIVKYKLPNNEITVWG